jgi:hypothetical protein
LSVYNIWYLFFLLFSATKTFLHLGQKKKIEKRPQFVRLGIAAIFSINPSDVQWFLVSLRLFVRFLPLCLRILQNHISFLLLARELNILLELLWRLSKVGFWSSSSWSTSTFNYEWWFSKNWHYYWCIPALFCLCKTNILETDLLIIHIV